MKTIFRINPELNIPIYQQLVDAIRAVVKRGQLTAGQQLPTVQEVAADLSIARGTIKRAYDELEREGLVEKVQGRGTLCAISPSIPEAGRTWLWRPSTLFWIGWRIWGCLPRRSIFF